MSMTMTMFLQASKWMSLLLISRTCQLFSGWQYISIGSVAFKDIVEFTQSQSVLIHQNIAYCEQTLDFEFSQLCETMVTRDYLLRRAIQLKRWRMDLSKR
eukprot:gene19422-21346_t